MFFFSFKKVEAERKKRAAVLRSEGKFVRSLFLLQPIEFLRLFGV